MRTPLRFAGLTVFLSVAVVAVAVLVLPSLATANDAGRPEPAADLPLLLPGAIEPAVADSAPAPDPTPPAATRAAPDPDRPVSSPVMPVDPGYWTPERMADAKPVPMPTPTPQPAAPDRPPPRLSAPASPPGDPNGSVSSPVMPFDPGYWTPERMADAKPMPMPTPR